MPSLITKISQLSIHHVGGRDGGGVRVAAEFSEGCRVDIL